MARFGYGRVSTTETVSRKNQHPENQVERLAAAGVPRENIRTDRASGTKASRPEWDKLYAHLREGDTLVVTKLDRLGRSLINLVDVVNTLGERKVELVILDMGIDTTTGHGRLIFQIMAALAEWEARMISERTTEGLAAARARRGGKLPGRGPSMTADQIATARTLFTARESNGMSAERIAQVVGVSRATLYRHLGG